VQPLSTTLSSSVILSVLPLSSKCASVPCVVWCHCGPALPPSPSPSRFRQSTGNLLQCHPHPEDLEDPQKADLHCVFYMGLARNPAVEQMEGGGQQEFDIRGTVEHFKDTVRGYQGWREGMDISVTHMKRKQLSGLCLPRGGQAAQANLQSGKGARQGRGGVVGPRARARGRGQRGRADPGRASGAGGVGGRRVSSPGGAGTVAGGSGGRGSGPVQKVARTSMQLTPFLKLVQRTGAPRLRRHPRQQEKGQGQGLGRGRAPAMGPWGRHRQAWKS